jgi:ribosomal protein S18 acetylase RimI-like enzyme
MQKAGLKYEGTSLESNWNNQGICDAAHYALLARDYIMVKNLQPLEIVNTTREELYEVAAFLDDCWRTEYRGIISADYLAAMSASDRHEKLLARFDETASDFLVVRDAGRLVGVAIFGKSYTDGYPDDGEISAIYLHHDYIGKGHGHALFAEVEAALAARGYGNFVLDVLSENTRAAAFYKKHGYENVAERTIRLGEQDYPLTVFRKTHRIVEDDILLKDKAYLERKLNPK